MIDNSTQDWFLLEGKEQDGWTAIRFKRYFDSCDPMDVPIKVIVFIEPVKYPNLSDSLAQTFLYLLMALLILICVNQKLILHIMKNDEVPEYYHFDRTPIHRQRTWRQDMITSIYVLIMYVTII